MTKHVITEHRGFLIVPVVDDDTGKLDYYDIHDWNEALRDFAGDWTVLDPEASFLPTKVAAKAWIADTIRWRRLRR